MSDLPKAEKAARDRAVQLLREHELDAYADELDENNFETGRKMIEYIEETAMPQIGEWGTVSIGKSTVHAIGRMKQYVDTVWTKFGIESDLNIVDIAERLNAAATRLAEEKRALKETLIEYNKAIDAGVSRMVDQVSIPDDPARPHIVKGEFQSDKYPKTPRGKVPLSVKDPLAMDLLWEYAQRHRQVDRAFSEDLEFALRKEGFAPESPRFTWDTTGSGEEKKFKQLFVHDMSAYGTVTQRPFEMTDMLKVGWYTAPPWLADVAEALGQKGLALNWNQMLAAVKQLKGSCTDWQESAAMACESPDPKCTCSGCSYAREKNGG